MQEHQLQDLEFKYMTANKDINQFNAVLWLAARSVDIMIQSISKLKHYIPDSRQLYTI